MPVCESVEKEEARERKKEERGKVQGLRQVMQTSLASQGKQMAVGLAPFPRPEGGSPGPHSSCVCLQVIQEILCFVNM